MNNAVPTGQQIAISGGDPHDPCNGTSTAAHLHFQIDKQHFNSPEPWFPSWIGRSRNQPDSDFSVTANTYNPIPFLTGGYRWTFWESNNREYWDLFNFSSFGVSNGAMWMDGNADPHVSRGGTTNCGMSRPCSSYITVEADQYKYVDVEMNNQCVNNPLQIYFTTKDSPDWGETKRVDYYLPDTGFNSIHVDMTQNSSWHGIVTGLRIDPAMNCQAAVFDPTYFNNITVQR